MPAVALPDGKLYNDKYHIPDPSKVEYVPRTDFLQSLVGTHTYDVALEDIILEMPRVFADKAGSVDLYTAASYYIYFKQKDARLPKFSKWISGMFAKDQTLAKLVAEAGQQAASRKITISTDVVDILRCADSPHFHSCFKWATCAEDTSYGYFDSGYHEIPTTICETTPGIAIAYIDDPKGKMLGRVWLHHAQDVETGENVIVMAPYNVSNALKPEVIARLLKEKFNVNAGQGTLKYHLYGEAQKKKARPIKYVGCFTKSIHHDLPTWNKDPVMLPYDVVNV